MQIGLIGLGNLGYPIAENILDKRKKLLVHNRTASKARLLIEKGALSCSSVKELASSCDVVFTIVSDDAALNHITKGAGGIAENLKPGGIHVSMSTILPATASSLAEIHRKKGSHYIAAPVMGRPEMARARKLLYLLSGEEEIIESIKPVLNDAGAAGTWEFGNQVAAANVAKLCSNFLIVSVTESLAEGISLARKSGMDPHSWINMITQTLFACPVYVNYSNHILNEKFQPAGFALKLGLKDVNLVMEQSRESGAALPLGELLRQRLNEAVAEDLGDHDLTALALLSK